MRKVKTFVCYPSEYENEAREIRGFVRSVGLDCWFDKESLIAGDDWDRERREALRLADLVIVLCAVETTSRNGVYQREINEALENAKDRRLGVRYIVPVRLAEVGLPTELSRLHYVDFIADRWPHSLAKALKKALEENGEQAPPNLDVAAAEPDEGGVKPQNSSEQRDDDTIEIDWFIYELNGEYWDYVNGLIRSRALGDLYQARRYFDEWAAPNDWKGGSYWETNLRQFYRKDQLVSITVGWSHYFAGAAHPNHGLETINIFGPEAGIIGVDELFNFETEPLKFLTEYANQDIVRQAESASEAWTLDSYVEQLGWDVFKHFSFNAEGIRLNLSSASGLPHVLGFSEIYLPWRHAERYLAPVAHRVLIG